MKQAEGNETEKETGVLFNIYHTVINVIENSATMPHEDQMS